MKKILVAGSAALLGGCAVLTVDVDVYTGPLINDEHIRAEQVAAMAIGARPLLVQLRADFEDRCSARAPGGKRKFKLSSPYAPPEQCIYPQADVAQDVADTLTTNMDCDDALGKSEWIPDRCLFSWRARRVNAVLGLYKDLADSDKEKPQTALTLGRRDAGIDSIVKEYFGIESEALLRTGAPAARDARKQTDEKRAELLAVLLDFGQKVVYLANFELLLPAPKSPLLHQLAPFRERTKFDVDSNARLLQAVGNSILNQVHDKKHWDEYRIAQRRTGNWRLDAHYKAEASVRNDAWAALTREINDDSTVTAEDKKAALASLSGGQKSLGEAAGLLEKFKGPAAQAWRAAADRAEMFASAKSSLELPDVAKRFKALGVTAKTVEEGAASMRTFLGDADVVKALEAKSPVKGVKYLDGSLEEIVKGASIENGTSTDKLYAELLRSATKLTEDKKKDASEAQELYTRRARWADSVNAAVAPHSAFPYPNAADELRDANEVLDRLIVSLQQQHILETRASLDNRAKSTAAALQLAQQYRSEGIFIRHSAVFLRDSYPATVLQKNPDGSNLLLSRAMRFGGPTETSHIPNTVDKQFWQTVNHIGLSGAGNITYVLTKDDVGNWYVKGYSAKPDEIYESAKNLVLFAAGSKVPSEVLATSLGGQTGLQKTSSAPGDSASSSAPSSERPRPLLDRQVDLAATSYEADLRNALIKARTAARGAQEALRSAGTQAVAADSGSVVNSVVDTNPWSGLSSDDANVKAMSGAQALKETLTLGKNLLAYRIRILGRIDDYKGTGSGKLTDDDAQKVRAKLREASNLMLRTVIGAADKATGAFDSKLAFVDESFPSAPQTADPRK